MEPIKNEKVLCGAGCLEEIELCKSVMIQDCFHEFHFDCITLWFKKSKKTTCPLCRITATSLKRSSGEVIQVVFETKTNEKITENESEFEIEDDESDESDEDYESETEILNNARAELRRRSTANIRRTSIVRNNNRILPSRSNSINNSSFDDIEAEALYSYSTIVPTQSHMKFYPSNNISHSNQTQLEGRINHRNSYIERQLNQAQLATEIFSNENLQKTEANTEVNINLQIAQEAKICHDRMVYRASVRPIIPPNIRLSNSSSVRRLDNSRHERIEQIEPKNQSKRKKSSLFIEEVEDFLNNHH